MIKEVQLSINKEEKIEKVARVISRGIELVLVVILKAINFLLRSFIRFCRKDIKGIHFVALTIVFICVLVILKLTYDTQLEMIKIVSGFEHPAQIEWNYQNKDKQPEEIKQEIQPEIVPSSSNYDTNRAKTFIKSYRMGNAPIINYVDNFFKEDTEKGKLALAICGNETAFGTVGYGINEFNCWGWKANLGGNSWSENIDNYMIKANDYLSMFDGTKESLIRIQDAGYHPVNNDKQIAWADNIMWFYNSL